MKLTDKLQALVDMSKVVQMERHGRPDCKNCNVAELLQEIIDEEIKNDKEYKKGYNTGYITARRKYDKKFDEERDIL